MLVTLLLPLMMMMVVVVVVSTGMVDDGVALIAVNNPSYHMIASPTLPPLYITITTHICCC